MPKIHNFILYTMANGHFRITNHPTCRSPCTKQVDQYSDSKDYQSEMTMIKGRRNNIIHIDF